jgi:hypothetical protein
MNLNKAEKRDNKRNKKNKMVVDNRSIFTLVTAIKNKADKAKGGK